MARTVQLPRTGPSAGLMAVIGLLAVVFLCGPALLNGSPLMFPDTRSYFLGGRVAVDKAHEVMVHLFGHPAAGPAIDAAVQQARGVRSAYYSLFTYLLTIGGSEWAVIVAQAALSAWVIWTVHRIFRADEPPSAVLWILAMMTLLTSLPWTVSFMMPDIFTPLLVLTLGCVLIQWGNLRSVQRVALLGVTGSSIVMHITNLPLALGLTLLVMGLQWRTFRSRMASYGAVAGVMGMAALAMLVVGVVGFHEWSIQPQSPPFLTARSLDDGPGKLYLRDHCPQLNFVMCRHLDRMDVGADDFIWHPEGVYSIVSPDDQAQMRREDKKLYLLAASEHPMMQLKAIVTNTIEQLLWFNLRDFHIPGFAKFVDGDMKLIVANTFPAWLVALSVLDYLTVLASCFILVHLWRHGRVDESGKKLIILVCAAVVLNAFAGAMSMPAPRYEARIIWLLPLAAAIFIRRRASVPAGEGVTS